MKLKLVARKDGRIVKSKDSDSKRLRIETERQPDSTWKAWAVDTRLVVFAKTKTKARKIVEMFFGDGGKDGTNTLNHPKQDDS